MLYGNLPTRETNKCQSLYKQGALLQLPKGCGSEAGCHIHVLVQGKSKTCPSDYFHLNLSREHALIQTDADAAAKLQKMLETKEDFEKKDKINRDLFGRKGNNSYL